jgi:hypothetical protein
MKNLFESTLDLVVLGAALAEHLPNKVAFISKVENAIRGVGFPEPSLDEFQKVYDDLTDKGLIGTSKSGAVFVKEYKPRADKMLQTIAAFKKISQPLSRRHDSLLMCFRRGDEFARVFL